MATLKELRARRRSIQSTRKITSAMKMIAASKLKKAQKHAENARPYAHLLGKTLQDLLAREPEKDDLPAMLMGRKLVKKHLFIVVSANRGLCGGFNTQIVRHSIQVFEAARKRQEEVMVLCFGQKAREGIDRFYKGHLFESVTSMDPPRFEQCSALVRKVTDLFEKGEIDAVTLLYNRYESALSSIPTSQSLIPFRQALEESKEEKKGLSLVYEYEPTRRQVLSFVVPHNLEVQLFQAMLESYASEQGARMAAMDGATRNAQDMMKALDLRINRTRQAKITMELVEIMSGAGAIAR